MVEFTAAAGAGIGPGEFQEFALSGGPFPDAESLTFPVVQTYSDGSESAWIEPTVDGQAEPEHPAPVLSLAADAWPRTRPGRRRRDGRAPHDEAPGAPPAWRCSWRSSRWSWPIAGVVLGWRATRRTVSS